MKDYSYWLGGDDATPVGRDPSKREVLKARLVHSLLYEPRLTLADSYWINNRNLRALTVEDEAIREFIAMHELVVARRETRPGTMEALSDLRDTFRVDGRQPPQGEFPAEDYARNDAFDYLEQHALGVPFQIETVARRFTAEVFKILREDSTAAHLTPQVALALRGIAESEQRRSPNGHLSFAFFYYKWLPGEEERRKGAGAYLDQYLGDGTWDRHQEAIRELIRGPYITGLPEQLDAVPIYSPEHSQAVDLWRRRQRELRNLISDPMKLESTMDLSTYFGCLQQVDGRFLRRIREKTEWEEYRSALRGDMRSEREIKDLVLAFVRYRRVLELEFIEQLRLADTGAHHDYRVEVGMPDNHRYGEWFFVTTAELTGWIPFAGDLAKTIYRKLTRYDPERAAQQAEARQTLEIEAVRKRMRDQEDAEGRRPIESTRTASQFDLRDVRIGG